MVLKKSLFSQFYKDHKQKTPNGRSNCIKLIDSGNNSNLTTIIKLEITDILIV